MAQVVESKSNLETLQIKFEEVSRQLQDREMELAQALQDLRLAKQTIGDKDHRISAMEAMGDPEKFAWIGQENQRLSRENEDLRSQLLRGGSAKPQSDTDSDISAALIPLMLREFNPANPQFKDAFKNLVEVVISKGDTISRLIGVLIKYGGEGSRTNLKTVLDTEEFDVAVEILEEAQLITIIEGVIHLASASQGMGAGSFEDLETGDLFKAMIEIAEKQPKQVLIRNMEEFRDVLQERQIPLTTIFFEIRKTLERIDRDQIERKDVVTQIENWYSKYQSLQ